MTAPHNWNHLQHRPLNANFYGRYGSVRERRDDAMKASVRQKLGPSWFTKKRTRGRYKQAMRRLSLVEYALAQHYRWV